MIRPVSHLITIAALCFFSSFAMAETEQDMVEAIHATNRTQVANILRAWAQNPARHALADQYFRGLSGDFISVRHEVAAWAFDGRRAPLYRAALTWLRGEPDTLSATERTTLNEKLTTCITADAAMRTVLTTRADGYQPFVLRQRTSPTVAAEVTRLVIPLNTTGFAIARALKEARALTGVVEVRFGETAPPVPLQLANAAQFNWAGFADYVLGSEPSLYGQLEAYRRSLSPTSVPTRAEVTQKMLTFIESGGAGRTENVTALRAAIRASLVGSEIVRYASSTNRGETAMTLNIDMRDNSDLRLARMLHPRADSTGLADVEMVNWNNISDRSRRPGWEDVNYPTVNQITGREGMRIHEVLDPINFENSPRSTAVSRKENLLKDAYTWFPPSMRGNCEALTGAASAVPATGK